MKFTLQIHGPFVVHYIHNVDFSLLQVVEDIKNQLKLKEPLLTFKTSCFRENLFYDVCFDDNIKDSYGHLRNFINKCLSEDEEDAPLVSFFIFTFWNQHFICNVHLFLSRKEAVVLFTVALESKLKFLLNNYQLEEYLHWPIMQVHSAPCLIFFL